MVLGGGFDRHFHFGKIDSVVVFAVVFQIFCFEEISRDFGQNRFDKILFSYWLCGFNNFSPFSFFGIYPEFFCSPFLLMSVARVTERAWAKAS